LSIQQKAGQQKSGIEGLNDVLELVADRKRARIMEAALKLGLAHGYARTTMDDIARAAEMSRPALYLLFRNKIEIYRKIASLTMQGCVETTRAALMAGGSFCQKLERAINEAMLERLRPFIESPYGIELLDLKTSLAADLVENWRHDVCALFAEAVRDEAQANGVDLATRGLSPEKFATMLMDALEGMRMRLPDVEARRDAATTLVKIVSRALRA
jgi:AcrR family transcriptional regulator